MESVFTINFTLELKERLKKLKKKDQIVFTIRSSLNPGAET
ncbi:hypothetical protein LMG6897_2301 [Lactococcus cremoris]|nr:hypothetical protein LMG6897_2301 [Lactococcus cremoris]